MTKKILLCLVTTKVREKYFLSRVACTLSSRFEFVAVPRFLTLETSKQRNHTENTRKESNFQKKCRFRKLETKHVIIFDTGKEIGKIRDVGYRETRGDDSDR